MNFRAKHIIVPVDQMIFRRIFYLALPVILGNLSRVLMNLVDVALVGRLGKEALAAVGMGGILIWTVVGFALAMRTGVQTVASRRLGQGEYKGCGLALNNGLLFAAVTGVVLSGAGYFSTENIIPFLLNDPAVIPLTEVYTKWGFLSVFFISLGFAFQGFFNGVERTRIHMQVTIVANLLNVYLDVGLIFGSENLPHLLSNTPLGNISIFAGLWTPFNFPALGVKGAAIATFIASVWLTIHYLLNALMPTFRREFGALRGGFDLQIFRRVVKIATPQGLQEVGVMIVFVLFFKIIAMVGTLELAVTQIAFVIMQASFLPAAGFGTACATLVGKYLGEDNPTRAEMSIVEGIRWAIIFMGSMGILFILYPRTILSFFTDDAEMIAGGVFALQVLGLIQFLDAVAMTLWNALSGAGETKFPAVVEMIIAWVFFLPLCYLLAVVWGYGIAGAWYCFAGYIGVYAIAVVWKTMEGKWKHIEV
ncbi:MAG: MATE family efflux transporter [Fidelibacterota bacterium]